MSSMCPLETWVFRGCMCSRERDFGLVALEQVRLPRVILGTGETLAKANSTT